MTNRCFNEIVYDLLKVLVGRKCETPLKIMYDRARVGSEYMRQKYIAVLETSGLATTTGHGLTDIIEITDKGRKYIELWEVVQRLLRSGLPDFPHPKIDKFPET